MITINHLTYEIYVSKDETTYVKTNPITGYENRELWLNDFRLKLVALLDDEEHILAPDIYWHTKEVVLSGVPLAKVIEFLAPYTFTFENGSYSVDLWGANSNLNEVQNPNSVALIPHNSVGLVGDSGSTEDSNAPTWDSAEGVTNAYQNGSTINLTWGKASDANDVFYNIYISELSSSVFEPNNMLDTVDGYFYSILGGGSEKLLDGHTYYVGVRAVDESGNETTNTNYASVVFDGNTVESKINDILNGKVGGGMFKDYNTNQLVTYNRDGTEADRFNCFDINGNPSLSSIDRMELT